MNDRDDNSVDGAPDVPPPELKPTILNRIYDGTVYSRDVSISSAKTVGRLGLGGLYFLGRHTGNALHSASLATGFHRLIEPPLPLSPLQADRKLSPYSKSYDLTSYSKFAKETAAKFASVKPIEHDVADGGTRKVNLYKLGGVGASIKTQVDANTTPGQVPPAGKGPEEYASVAQELGDISADSTLAGREGLQGKCLDLFDKIKENDDQFHTPAQISNAFKQLKSQAITDLQAKKKAAIDKIKATLMPKDGEDLTACQNSFAFLCAIPDADDDDVKKAKLKDKVEQVIDHVSKEYAKAEKSIAEYFDGVPGTKDSPEDLGLIKKLAHEKERVEADLLLRISHLERMLKRNYDIRKLDPTAVGLEGGADADAEEDKEFKSRCLQGVTLQRLLKEEKWAGKYYGETKVDTLHTRNGLTLVYQTKADGSIAVTGLKIPPQWFLTDAAWQKKVELALEDYVSALKIDQKPGEKLALTINHPEDKNRNMLVLAAYRAAIVNGIKPADLEFTVTGSKEEKGNVAKKPALEVLKQLGLGADDPLIQQDLEKHERERQQLEQRENTTSIKDSIASLKLGAGKEIKDYDDKKSAPDTDPSAPRI